MLSPATIRRRASRSSTANQRGIVLILTLIVLVAMTLASVALMRSTSTSNLVAGNLAFRQAAMHSGDAGIEAAIAWLENNNGQTSSATATTCSSGATVLTCNQTTYGYLAARSDPTTTQSWDDYWRLTVVANSYAKSLAADAAGNTVAYVIQRMCNGVGDPTTASIECSVPPSATGGTCAAGSSCDSQKVNLNAVRQYYYRITVKVTGPRNTQSYTQAMVAM